MALSKIQAESMNLADTYAFTGTVTGASDMALLQNISITSGVNSVSWDSTYINDSYETYIIFWRNITIDATGNMGFRVGVSSGLSTSIYSSAGMEQSVGSTVFASANGTGQTRGTLSGNHDNQVSGEPSSGKLELYNLRKSGHEKHCFHTNIYWGTNNRVRVGGTHVSDTNVHSFVEIGNIGGGGNMVSGEFSLYGLKG